MIPAERSHLHVAAKTHPGISGKNNEDRFAVSAFRLEGDKPLPAVFAIISDGIGGHRAGEVASELVVEIVSHAVAASDGSTPVETMSAAIAQASQEIHTQAESDLHKRGMGATCACLWVIDDRVYAAYVGDTRIYLLRGKEIQQLTIDHTWVQEAIDAGILTPEEARNHPNAHVIRRFLGSAQPVEADTRLYLDVEEGDIQAQANQGFRLNPGDQIIACSDGLTDLVNPDEILSAIRTSDQEQALDQLIALANERGGHDNITIVSLEAPGTPPETKPAAAPPTQRKRCLAWLGLAVVLLIIFIALGLLGAFLFLRGSTQPTPTPSAMPTIVETQPVVLPTAIPNATDTSEAPPASPTQPATPSPEIQASPSTPAETLTAWPTNTLSP